LKGNKIQGVIAIQSLCDRPHWLIFFQ
jgi:hypothetical protein